MGAYKDKNGTWYAQFRFTNWKGEADRKTKRGFATKKEALEWEREFLTQNAGSLEMTFEAFYEMYKRNLQDRLKKSTWKMKISVIESKILPYFKKKRIVYLKVSRMRKKLAIALLMILLIALSVAGIAYCIKRGVLNFNEGLNAGTEMVWHENAVELVESGIIQHIELEHVDIDVIETAYDGHELRVVYGVTSKMGQIKPIEGFEGSYEVPGAEEDGVHVCDYIRVNGQDAYFYDIYEAVGENPNQLLYYLQTNLTAWDIPEEEIVHVKMGIYSIFFTRTKTVWLIQCADDIQQNTRWVHSWAGTIRLPVGSDF